MKFFPHCTFACRLCADFSACLADMHGSLVSPGPDLVICDEGHRIKNNAAGISQQLKNIKTK